MVAFLVMAPPLRIHLHQGDHEHLAQEIAVMQMLHIQRGARCGLAAVGEAHQLGIAVFPTGQHVVDLCGQQLGGAAEPWPEALDG